MVTAAMKSEDIASRQESYDKPRQCVEKQRYYSANKGPYSQGYGFPSGHVQLWELDWMPDSYLDSKEIKAVNLKGNQLWIVERTDAEVETSVFW